VEISLPFNEALLLLDRDTEDRLVVGGEKERGIKVLAFSIREVSATRPARGRRARKEGGAGRSRSIGCREG
jgi:hypothetical protein